MAKSGSKESTSARDDNKPSVRRKDMRVAGPFEGRWVGALTVPVHIHDLSLGGCLIHAYHEQVPGRRFTLEIDLPYRGSVTVEAESLYVRAGYGYAAKFVKVSPETQVILEEVIWKLLSKNPSDV